jgi:cation diffusion facilitator CzcD-associated flavoprotein CzcO
MAAPGGVLDVLVVGAGFAGICAGKRLLDAGIDEFLIVEKSAGIGGTWWENTYPGAACDVPSHLYCFSFAPNPEWSRKYSPRPEIQAYLARCVDRFGLRKYLAHDRDLRRLEFLDERGLWRAHFADGQVIDARHVILGSGGLHEPKLPEIPGIESFSGRWMHSAQWQKGFNLNGLRVAIVGSAASAIQILPAIAPRVASATLFQRTPNYILPREDRAYSAREKLLFRHVPGLLRLYRSFIFLRMDLLLYPITREVSGLRGRARRMMLRFMRTQVRDPSCTPSSHQTMRWAASGS